MDFIGQEDLTKAYVKYRQLRGLPRNSNSFNQFLHFLDMDIVDIFDLFSANEEAKQKVRWLLGPHAQAIYKAWVVQNPDKVDWP